jgi:hypothetical protein
VVTTPLGDVSEVHVLASAGLSPKQVVRNVESALLAHLGLKVDHRKISVAQTADVRPIAVLDQGAVRDRASRRAVLFEDLGVASGERAQRVVVTVSVTTNGRTETGREEVADTPRGRLEGSARATAAALERLVEKGTLAVEEVKLVPALDRTVVLVVVRALGGREARLLTGTAEVRESAERSAVFAVLDATNRWVDARRAG